MAISSRGYGTTPLGTKPNATVSGLQPMTTMGTPTPRTTAVTAVGGDTKQTVPNVLPESYIGGTVAPYTPQAMGQTTIQGTAPTSSVKLGDAPQVAGYQIPEAHQAQQQVIGDIERAQAERAQAARIGQLSYAQAQLAEAERAAAARFDTAAQESIRNRQLALMDEMERVIAGTAGPSVAELQYQQTSEQAARQQQGIASARAMGGNFGLAQREAAINMGNIQAQASQGQAILRAQETAATRQALGQLQGTARGQDIDVATTQGGWQNAVNLQNAQLGTQANLQNAALGTQVSQFNAGQENAAMLQQAQMENAVNMANAQMGTATNQFNAGQFNQNQQAQANLNASTDQFNVGQYNQQQQAQAQITTQINIQNASNQLSKMLEQARLDQQNGQFNASLQQQINIAQAQLKSQIDQFNTNWSNQAAANYQGQEFTAKQNAANREIQKAQIAAGVLNQPIPADSGGSWWQAGGALLGAGLGALPALIPGGAAVLPVTIPLGAQLGATAGGAAGANNNAADEERRRREEELRRLGLAPTGQTVPSI